MLSQKQPNLFSAISIGICCMIGSGWLFASYYAAKYAGGISILSWCLGAFLALLIAFMLAEIAAMFPDRGLFARLVSLSHNRDFGFVFAISNWLGIVLSISSEAVGTIQYLSTISPRIAPYFFNHHQLTLWGALAVIGLLVFYGLINYWGMRSMTKVNLVMATLKICIPILTAVFLIVVAFHPGNFVAYQHSFAPYGISHAFSAIITCGIFYAFYGFSSIATFGAELKNPRRNIPIALVCAILLCLLVYLTLQIAFIGALPTNLLANGWHHLNFTSPLAQLLIILNLNVWAIILYADAAISPSGAGIAYTGTATRMFTGMAIDRQMPKFFQQLNPTYLLSRRSLFFTLGICIFLLVFFNNWQKIMLLTSVFYVISCISVPVSFCKFRETHANTHRPFKLPCGKVIGLLLFFVLTYLLIQINTETLILALILHIILFLMYSLSYYQYNVTGTLKAIRSSWSIFAYLGLSIGLTYFKANYGINSFGIILFFVTTAAIYYALINQEFYVEQHKLKGEEIC